MRGDRVGALRRAIPTAATHVEPAQHPRRILFRASTEDDETSRKRTADPCHTCRV
jgi:hypothetical protein